MRVTLNMITGEIDRRDEHEEEILSSGWNPAVADMIRRELEHYEISRPDHSLPKDLVDIDVEAFVERMSR